MYLIYSARNSKSKNGMKKNIQPRERKKFFAAKIELDATVLVAKARRGRKKVLGVAKNGLNASCREEIASRVSNEIMDYSNFSIKVPPVVGGCVRWLGRAEAKTIISHFSANLIRYISLFRALYTFAENWQRGEKRRF
jgi:hypothetical protein